MDIATAFGLSMTLVFSTLLGLLVAFHPYYQKWSISTTFVVGMTIGFFFGTVFE